MEYFLRRVPDLNIFGFLILRGGGGVEGHQGLNGIKDSSRPQSLVSVCLCVSHLPLPPQHRFSILRCSGGGS